VVPPRLGAIYAGHDQSMRWRVMARELGLAGGSRLLKLAIQSGLPDFSCAKTCSRDEYVSNVSLLKLRAARRLCVGQFVICYIYFKRCAAARPICLVGVDYAVLRGRFKAHIRCIMKSNKSTHFQLWPPTNVHSFLARQARVLSAARS
jgi:hypothetical protein